MLIYTEKVAGPRSPSARKAEFSRKEVKTVLKRKSMTFLPGVWGIFPILLLSLLVGLWFTNSALSLDPQPIGRWPLDEKSGDEVHDVIGKNNGKFVGGTLEWVPAKFGNGLKFDEAGIYSDIPRNPDLESPDSVTLSAWANVEKSVAKEQTIVSYADSYNLIYGGKYTNFGAAIHRAGGWVDCFGKTPANFGEWYFVAMTYDSQDVKLYVNGELDGTTAAPGEIDYFQERMLRFGESADPGDHWAFNGIIDEVTIWDRAMTAEEVMEVYESPIPELAVSLKGSLSTTWGELKNVNPGRSIGNR